MQFFRITLLLAVSLSLFSCRSLDLQQINDEIETKYGFEKKLIKGGDFVITSFHRNKQPNQPYIFYIEGDGLAFIGRYQISPNPTPRSQMLIKLAALDPRPNIVYIARPCQYTPMELNQNCNSTYWTDKRMSDEVVTAINAVINQINQQQKFTLVGFSGGGGVAVLVAARNKMVKNIVTLAGNLDHIAFSTYHQAEPIKDSLNPIDYVWDVRHIPQIHLSGASDKIVPPFIAKKFAKLAASDQVQQKTLPGVSHSKGWQEIWPEFCQN